MHLRSCCSYMCPASIPNMPFPEFFPHSLGDPDFEPEMGFVTYDGYEPTPSMLP